MSSFFNNPTTLCALHLLFNPLKNVHMKCLKVQIFSLQPLRMPVCEMFFGHVRSDFCFSLMIKQDFLYYMLRALYTFPGL